MKIVVTGANGLVGSSLIKKIIKEPYNNISAIDINIPTTYKNVNYYQSDLTKAISIKLLNKLSPDTIIHCAAVVPTKFDEKDTNLAANKNMLIDSTIIEYCKNKLCKLIYLSSTSIYGLTRSPWSENSTPNPQNAYSKAKLISENQIIKYLNNYYIFRLSAPYAPQQKIKTVIQIFITNAINNENILYFGSGKRQQDFIFIDDIISAILLSIKNKTANKILNLASGNSISMIDLAKLILKSLPNSSSNIMPANCNDPQENYRGLFKITNIQNELGWTPQVSLKEGILNCISYLKH